MMNEEVMLMEYVLMEKTKGTGYSVRIRKSTGGNLPKRAPFIRKVLRQATLFEYMPTIFGDTHEAPEYEHEKWIYYTVHPRFFKDKKIIKLYNMLLQDLDDYIRENR